LLPASIFLFEKGKMEIGRQNPLNVKWKRGIMGAHLQGEERAEEHLLPRVFVSGGTGAFSTLKFTILH
jgi:hypothetical protein